MAPLIYDESERDRSQAYLEVQPLFATGRIALLDHPVMIRELKCLERRPRAGGRTLVEHPGGGHDDHANALCLAAAILVEGAGAGLAAVREWAARRAAEGVRSPEEIAAAEAAQQRETEEQERVKVWHRPGAWSRWG